MQKQLSPIIVSIENQTSLDYKEILFDSQICNWNKDTTFITNQLFNKSHLAFIVEIDDNLTVGGYFPREINTIDDYLFDSKAFIFNYSHGKMEIYNSIPNHWAFKLYTKEDYELFSFGYSDLTIMKECRKQYSRSSQSDYDMK